MVKRYTGRALREGVAYLDNTHLILAHLVLAHLVLAQVIPAQAEHEANLTSSECADAGRPYAVSVTRQTANSMGR